MFVGRTYAGFAPYASIMLTRAGRLLYNVGMAENEQLGVRVPPEIKAALAEAAQSDRRSVSSLVTKVLSDWLEAGGWLKPKIPKTSPSTSKRRAT